MLQKKGNSKSFSHIFLNMTPGKQKRQASKTMECLPLLIFLELMGGLELPTCALRVRCSTN
jgi:hypothetical protein